MANEIVWFDSSEAGAPTLNNSVGTVIGILDACLVNGFNVKTVTITVSGGVATATASAHGYSATVGKLITIAGATPAGLNGIKQISTVPDANTFTFAAPGVADGVATGTITARRTPLGWAKVFTGTNKAVYKSSDPASTGRYLRVDDTGAADARVVMYESMTDIDTGTNPAPTAAQQSGGFYFGKGTNNTNAKSWLVCGDGRAFYYFAQWGSSTVSHYAHFFGDIVSYRASDVYGCLLSALNSTGDTSSNSSSPISYSNSMGSSMSSNNAGVFSRMSNQVSVSPRISAHGIHCQGATSVWAGASQTPSYPSPVDNGLILHRPIYLSEDNAAFNYPVRGELPGAMQPLGGLPFNHRDVITGIDGFPGSALFIALQNSSTTGRFVLDITGPWR